MRCRNSLTEKHRMVRGRRGGREEGGEGREGTQRRERGKEDRSARDPVASPVSRLSVSVLSVWQKHNKWIQISKKKEKETQEVTHRSEYKGAFPLPFRKHLAFPLWHHLTWHLSKDSAPALQFLRARWKDSYALNL